MQYCIAKHGRGHPPTNNESPAGRQPGRGPLTTEGLGPSMADPTLLEQLTGVQIDDAGQAALLGAGFAAVILAGQLVFKLLRAIRRAATRPGRRAPRADMVATVIG